MDTRNREAPKILIILFELPNFLSTLCTGGCECYWKTKIKQKKKCANHFRSWHQRRIGSSCFLTSVYCLNPMATCCVCLTYTLHVNLHMLKLMRNCLGNREILFTSDEKKIEWKYFVRLVKLQLENNINFGNKLTKTHLQFEDKKMNVRIAAETLSDSTADSMQFANSVLKLDLFEGSEATQEYFASPIIYLI